MNKKTIKNKIKSTQSIKKITRTMEMVSVAKMKKALNIAEAYKTFGIEAKKILNVLASQREKYDYATAKNSEVKLLIVIAGQKGLCGGYNSNIYRKILKDYKVESENSNLRFICIGKYAEKIARRFDAKDSSKNINSNISNSDSVKTKTKKVEASSKINSNIILSFIGKEFTSSDVRVLIKNVTTNFVDHKYKSVELIYTDFENINTQVVSSEVLLPFKSKNINILNPDMSSTENKLGEIKDKHKNSLESNSHDDLEYTFEPSIEQVYEYTVKILLQNIISGSVLRARAAEHAARMMAMKTATDSASEMIGELKLWYNKARQAAITQEIAEISSAAMAMQSK